MPSHPRSPIVASLVIAIALSLAGCTPQWFLGGGGPEGTSDTASSSPDVDADDSTEGEQCTGGKWLLDNDSWAAALESLFAVADAGTSTVDVTGVVEMHWKADNSYSIVSDDSEYEFAGTTGGVPYLMRVLHNGTETGEWSVDADGVHTQVNAGGEVDSVVSMGTSEADLTVMEEGILTPPLFSGTMTVVCTPAGLETTITDDGVTVTIDWVRLGS